MVRRVLEQALEQILVMNAPDVARAYTIEAQEGLRIVVRDGALRAQLSFERAPICPYTNLSALVMSSKMTESP